ncbi:extracellular solute-binding protein [Pseudoflavonifractor sp. 60]|uniref:ABC transporter substrate-binding protein n=1 Tax=Pseudoflavonifractor sp. 60 TaxID=2304576 RepID=UPI00136AD64F|nr:extracellular solute-binding protein [Pseudoflavonifractor sp. 60]NBI65583.1 extracellular solute-binding protein [Pseudoflavonifractor sp. 60]
MKMKKLVSAALAMVMLLSLAACGGGNQGGGQSTPNTGGQSSAQGGQSDPAPADGTTITAWIYPVGGWQDEKAVQPLIDEFTAATGIKVNLEWLAYADGDDKVNTALTAKNAPDLIMEGPERLVANWGANGYMVDLSDMIDDTDRSEINAAALAACTSADGKIYQYPMFITAHCMAVNLDAFKAAGADQYLNLDTHTWTTDDFIKAVEALYAKKNDTVAAVYCKGQSGDQGTRALINNMYGGTFTNAEHTQYTWDDPNNIKALEQLKSMKGIAFDASLEGGDELKLMYQEILDMAFCWNIAQQLDPAAAGTGAGKTISGQEIVCMNFPSPDGTPVLQGGIWGLGIFNNGDQARIDAAKEFVKWMCDSEHAAEAAKVSNFFAARSAAEGTDLSNIFADNAIMTDYNKVILPNLGDYYQITAGWAGARTEWWTMLQEVGNGQNIADSVANHVAAANALTAG